MKKISKLLLVVSIFLLVLSQTAFAKDNYSKEERIYLLNLPAFSADGNASFNSEYDKYSQSFEEKYLIMSDADFDKAMKDNLKNIIKKHEDGYNLRWNEVYNEKIVKTYYPAYYEKIKSQIKKDKEASTETSSTMFASLATYTPGSRDMTQWEYGYNNFGTKLYGLSLRCYWTWDSTKITSVSPSTSAELYAPLWKYEGLNENIGRFITPTDYYLKKIGHFSISIEGYPIFNTYGEHIVDLYPNNQLWLHDDFIIYQ